jgi:molecular chaperone GrpE
MTEKHENHKEHHKQNNMQNENQSGGGANFSQPLEGDGYAQLRNEFALLQGQILNYEKEISGLKDSLARVAAEMDNQKKRHVKDMEATAKFGTTTVLKDIIDPLEQLFIALAIQISPELQANEMFKSIFGGIEMTKNLFEKALLKHGLERIYPKGEQFNHDTQQAISQIPQEGVDAGIVIDVVQAGYVLHGRVIKPALVVVAG